MTLHGSMLSYVANSHESAWDEYREVKDKALRLGLHATAAGRWNVRGNDLAAAPSLEGSGPGIQLLYVATFGEAPLDEVQWTNKNGER